MRAAEAVRLKLKDSKNRVIAKKCYCLTLKVVAVFVIL